MEHTSGATGAQGTMQMQAGDRFDCPNCGCRITLERHGEPDKMPNMRPFTCCCGTQMTQETSR